MKRKVSILIFILCSTMLINAQVKKTPVAKSKVPPPVKADRKIMSTKIHSVARAQKKEILIRWAPSDEGAWSMGNKYGYAVERYTILRDGKLVDRTEKPQSRIVFKPRPLQQWDSILHTNDNAAVMAQAIYGDEFDVEMSDTSGMMHLVNQTEKLVQRYTMSMYAADQSFEAAEFAGLGYRDNNVKPNEKYFYRVYSLIPKSMRLTDTALLYISPAEYQPLPKPSIILPRFGDKAVMLTWDFDSYREYYTSYIIERSADSGKTFEPVSPRSVTKLNESDPNNAAGGSMLYMDELPDNETVYQYRIAGKSLFGETGPYSDVAAGKGETQLPFTPHITGISLAENGSYVLNWELEDSLNNQVKEFQVNLAPIIEGPYTTQKTGIEPGSRSFEVNSLHSANYYTVTVIPKEGVPRTSMPYLLQPEDSIAPAVPKGFEAQIDSMGVVTLRWHANTEKDLAGYKIYKTYVKGHEFAPVMDSLWFVNEFHDTVDLKNLNHKVYYSIRAVDNRYNQSDYTQVLEVTKPDIIPPTSPVMSDFDVSETGIRIQWVNSSDEDVVQHKLFRRQIADTVKSWTPLEVFTDKRMEWTDKEFTEGATYAYTVVAMDKSQLESPPAMPLTITAPEKRVRKAVNKLDATVNRKERSITLNWTQVTDLKSIRRFELFRAQDKQPMSLYKQIDTQALSFTDKDLLVNSRYQYAIRAVYANGGYSDFVIKQVIY